MNDSVPAPARSAAAAVIVAKRDELLRERAMLQERRAEILMQTRRNDRELADCRAAARLFQVEIDFPTDEDEADREMLRRRQMRDIEEREAAALRARAHAISRSELEVARNRAVHGRYERAPLAAPSGTPVASPVAPPVAPPAEPPSPVKAARPSLRVFLLDMLTKAGPAGAKAAPLRELFERAYGEVIHEKTVGMTLYRLSKEGLVRRDGHNWFFVPQTSAAATENPGGDAPGSDNRLI